MDDLEDVPEDMVEVEPMGLRCEDALKFADRIGSEKSGRGFEYYEVSLMGHISERAKDVREFINLLMENDFSEFKIGICVERLYSVALKRELIEKSEILEKQNELIDAQSKVIELMEDVLEDASIKSDKYVELVKKLKGMKKDLRKNYTSEQVMSMMMIKSLVDLAEREDDKKLKSERRKKAGFKG